MKMAQCILEHGDRQCHAEPTSAVGALTTPTSISLTSSYGGSLKNKAPVTGELNSTWKNSKRTLQTSIYGQRQGTAVYS